MSDQQTSWGVVDVLLMSTKNMCVFYHQWCIDQRNLHEIQPHLSDRNLNNSTSQTNPSLTKHCTEPCF